LKDILAIKLNEGDSGDGGRTVKLYKMVYKRKLLLEPLCKDLGHRDSPKAKHLNYIEITFL